MGKRNAIQMNRSQQLAIARYVIENRSLPPTPDTVTNYGSRGWGYYFNKFDRFLQTGNLEFKIIVTENRKEPFPGFASFPVVDCPGAGACVDFCYSLNSTNHPNVYFRLLQNSILMRNKDPRIAHAIKGIPHGSTVRLFTDGDYPNLDCLKFFIEIIRDNPQLTFYSYTKSFIYFYQLRRSGVKFPPNYWFNASDGSKFPQWIEKLKPIPTFRGEFIALPTPTPIPNRDIDPIAWKRGADQLRSVARDRGLGSVFICPGDCRYCLPNGEIACASPKFKDIPIVIRIHGRDNPQTWIKARNQNLMEGGKNHVGE